MKEKIIEILKNENTSVLSIENLYNILELNTQEEYENLQKELNELCKDATLYLSNKGKYLLFENSHLIKGKLQLKEQGYGFILNTGLEKDIFIPKNYINGALTDDIVAVEFTNKQKNEGRIVKIIKRDDSKLIGKIEIVKDKCYFRPDKKNLPILEITNNIEYGCVDGHKVLVQRHYNKGTITKVIGHINDPNIDMLSIIYEHEFSPSFPENVINSLEDIPDSVNTNELKGREDLRKDIIFTIDGADTKDVDDAISIKKNNDGTYTLGVHIANVSYYVKKGGTIDLEAYERGTSVYLTDRVLPMLPPKLSNGICSLNPNVDRLAISCIMTIDENGKVIDRRIVKSVINSKKKMTYEDVNKILEENIIPEGYEDFASDLYTMQELSLILRKKMVNRGYIDFDAREVKIIVDENNHPIDIKLREQRTAEKLIENFMIVANETVAEYIYNMDLPGIYRVHDKPVDKKIDSFFEFLSAKGISITGIRRGKYSVKDLQDILNKIEDNNSALVYRELLIRSMAKAIYSSDNIGHFGLGSKCYSHFTSPIRRYPDLTLHRLLDTYLDNYSEEKVETWALELPIIAEHCSVKERDADECEYDVEDMKMAEYMQDHIGEKYEGIISGVQSFGIFVTIIKNGVEGLIKCEYLGNESFVFHEKERALVGTRTKRKFSLGDKIIVEVIKADKLLREIDFKNAEGEKYENKPRKAKCKKKKKN